MVGGALLLGFYLVYTHRDLSHTLAGFILWAIAFSLSLVWFPQVPGAGVFPIFRSQEIKNGKEWSPFKITLAAGGVLVALGLSSYFQTQARMGFLLIFLLVLGLCLSFVENHIPQPLKNKPFEPAPVHKIGFPWAAAVILLFGSFFLFHRWDAFITGYDVDALKSQDIANACMGVYPTPYVDGWGPGQYIFPYFPIGLFYRLVGPSFHNGVLFTVLINLVGYLFFYGFVRFYLPKFPALAATLFFSASHWVLWPAREITGARGMVLPIECAALYFFARALEKGQARDFVLTGTFLAFSLLTSIHGWIFLVLFILTLLAIWVGRRSAFQSQKKSWALALFAVFLWFFPVIVHDKTYDVSLFPSDLFKGDIIWKESSFFVPWHNLFLAIQQLNVGSVENLMAFLPLLSPWEGLFLLTGLGWCFRRFTKPFSFFIILGLLGGLAPAVLTGVNTSLRSLAAAPFVYLLVGVGLDRLTMAATAPLGHRGRSLRFLLGMVFLALSVGWQYDVYFNKLPWNKDAYWNPNGRVYFFGTITAQHLEGWDTYVDLVDGTWERPENDYFYSRSDMEKGRRIIFRPALSSLPLKNIPQKGALILLSDRTGKAFQDWINYYYPSTPEKEIRNPFGDVEYRLWEIPPSQIQEALKRRGSPESMTLSWFDAQNRKLGQWQIPALSTYLLDDEWFAPYPGDPVFPLEKTAYFVVQGRLKNLTGKALAIESNGKVDGFIGNQKVQLDCLGSLKRLEIPLLSQKPGGFKIRYVLPKGGRFYLNLLEKTPLGWDMIPSSELNP